VSRFYIDSARTLSTFIGELREAFREHKYVRGSWRIGKDRSLDQNAVSHCWYEQVADELREDEAQDVKRFCKLHFGVPILRADEATFREMYDATFKKLTYPQKLKAMDFLDVTSIMSTKQMARYMGELQEHYRTRGVILEFQTQAKQ